MAAADPTPEVNLLDSFRIDPELPDTPAFQKRFTEVADVLLNRVDVLVGTVPYRLVEIEFYLCGGAHNDTFTHRSTEQTTHGSWYFHKHGKHYRDGTYKGLDITVGTPDKAHAGILIRAMQEIKSGLVIDGPCKSVDNILKVTGHSDITSFVEAAGGIGVTDAIGLQLRSREDLPRRTLVRGPRVGLTLRTQEQQGYWMADYRFTTVPSQMSKHRIAFALGTYRIRGVVPNYKIQDNQWKKCSDAYNQARKGSHSLDQFTGVVLKSAVEIAEAYGTAHNRVNAPVGGVEEPPVKKMKLNFFGSK